MGMNRSELQHIANEMEGLLGASVSGAWQPSRDRVIIGLGRFLLLLVPRGNYARVHLIPRRPKNPSNPYSFQGACRTHLHGPLQAVELHPKDRILTLKFPTSALHLRLMRNEGGLWILRDRSVMAAYDGPAPEELPSPKALPNGWTEPPVRFEPEDDQTWSEAAHLWFSARERRERTENLRRMVARRLASRIKRETRLIEALNRDLKKAEQADITRQRADALAAVLHRVDRGVVLVDAPDLINPECTHSIQLDPKLSPGKNLARLYERSRRLERMADRVLEHLEQTEQRLQTLISARRAVADADERELKQLQSLLPNQTTRRHSNTPNQPWFTWIGPKGQLVFAGKNAAGNRRLTFQVARGDDIWLHIRGRPGAHVLLPVARGKTPSLENLLAAAQIVLVHAKVSEGDSVDVQYTQARHVRSIKGAADGRVQLAEERVLHITRQATDMVGWRRMDVDSLDISALDQAIRQ